MTRVGVLVALVSIRTLLALKWKGGGNATAPEGKLTDLVCMRNTGHRCRYFACDGDKFGTDICEDTKCICELNSCATAEGRCESPEKWGKWLSTHAIKFVDPAQPHAPYIGAVLDKSSGSYTVQATWNSTPIWNLALSHDNYTRFELAESLGQVLSAKLECEQLDHANASYEGYANHKKCMYKPAIIKFADAHPLDVDFLVHWTIGGLEIWDPQFGVAFSSTEVEEYPADSGIELCGPGNLNVHRCLTRKFIEFEPPLPKEAISTAERLVIHQIQSVIDEIGEALSPSMSEHNRTQVANTRDHVTALKEEDRRAHAALKN